MLSSQTLLAFYKKFHCNENSSFRILLDFSSVKSDSENESNEEIYSNDTSFYKSQNDISNSNFNIDISPQYLVNIYTVERVKIYDGLVGLQI